LIASLLLLRGTLAQDDAKSEEGIDHLVPVRGLHDDKESWDYEAKLRKILLTEAPEKPAAFALVKTGPGAPEFCVSLIKEKDDRYFVEVRQATRNVWYGDKDGENPVKVYREAVPAKKGKEIEGLWARMLQGVRHPGANKKYAETFDGGETYFAAWILGKGIMAGETDSPVKRDGDVSKMEGLARWMCQHAFKLEPVDPAKDSR
jgi:hypothetical protein